jgi:DNA-binding NarL/FixJ family response regulator
MIRVLIADDHAVVRQGLRQILEETSDIVIGGEASHGGEVLEKVRARAGDVLVLDLSMPGRSGLDILKEVKQERPTLPVIVLSMHSEEQYAARVLKAGASGYLPKESAPEAFAKAIRKVYAGGRYLTSTQTEKLMGVVDRTAPVEPHEKLSDREHEVFCLIASGKTVSQIAAQMTLSVKTISTYRTRILDKMGMKTNAELTHYAIKNQLVS